MSLTGYFILPTDLARWLDAAQRQPSTKNKVRKDLWANLSECIHYFVSTQEYPQYIRIPRAHFVTIQTFCLVDGRGQDNLNSDALLSFVTTLDELRQLASAELALAREVERKEEEHRIEEEELQEAAEEAVRSATKVKSGRVVRE